jgi:hypothetical protein
MDIDLNKLLFFSLRVEIWPLKKYFLSKKLKQVGPIGKGEKYPAELS